MANRAYFSLGSNLGDSPAIVLRATRVLAELGCGASVSSLYLTAPQGGPPQPPYYNAVVGLNTAWRPSHLLVFMQQLEQRFGRERRIRWGPRTLDCDLLLYGTFVIQEPLLTVPHPRMLERRFVLEPLSEIGPDLVLGNGRLVTEMLQHTLDQEVTRVCRISLYPNACAILNES